MKKHTTHKGTRSITSLTILAAMTGIVPAAAQNISLGECINEGLENAYQIKIVRMSEEKSANNDSWNNAGALPTLSITGSYSGSLGSTDYVMRSDGSTSSSRDIFDQSLSASVRSDWTLFNGFSILAERNRLEELHRAGEIQTRVTIEDYVAELATQYYNLVRQTIHLHNLEYAADLSRHRLRIVQDRYDMGSASRLDLKQAQVYFNSDSASSVKQHEAVVSACIKLNRLMSNQNLEETRMPENNTIELSQIPGHNELYDGMMSANASLLKAESSMAVAQLDRKAVQSRNYPYLKMNASYGYTHNDYGSSTYSTRDNWGPSVGLTVGMNLVTGKQRVQERNARLTELSAQAEIDQLELQLRANLTDLWQSYENNLKLLNLERENLIAAQETHEIAEERYMLGDLSGLEMREAQKTLLSAEESLLSAEYNTKICEISLLLISGRIMDILGE